MGLVAIAFYFALRAFLRQAESLHRFRWFEASIGLVLAVLLTFFQYRNLTDRDSVASLRNDLQKIQTDNTSLQQKLSEAQKQIETLETSGGGEATVRARLDQLQTQLNSMRRQ